MNKPLPLESVDTGPDFRDAARQAAREEGKSLGEWLDALLEDRATALGLSVSDLASDQSGASAPRRPSLATVRAGDAWAAEPAEDQRTASSGRPDVPHRSEIEAKLNALLKALNRPVGRPLSFAAGTGGIPGLPDGPEAPSALLAEPGPSQRITEASLLGRTALTSPRTLDRAIAEITDRQAALGQVATPAPDRAVRRIVEDAAEPATATSVAPATQAAIEPFAALKDDIARLAQRLENGPARPAVAPRPEAPAARAASLDEVRALLDRVRPDQSIDALERRVESLTSKIDRALEQRAGPEAIQHLSQRIEDVHASIADRLAAPPTVDTGSLEQVVREIVASVGAVQKGLPDVQRLETMMLKIADKLDEPREPSVDAELFAELQAQVGALGQRIDRSDAGLTAIVSVERSLGELFSQLEETRDAAITAAETAARNAAKDTLRSVMADNALSLGQAQRHTDVAVEQVTHDIAELREARDAADKRLHGILNALNGTLEKIIDRLGDLETERAGFSASAPPSDTIGDLLAAAEAAQRSRVSALPERAPAKDLPHQAEDGAPVRSAAVEVDDLIEPSVPRASARPATAAPVPAVEPATAPTVQPDPANFIAAARRAAQAAAQSSAEDAAARSARMNRASSRPTAAVMGTAAKAPGPTAAGSRRRPLLLALASVVLLMGAVQVVRLSLRPADPSAVADRQDDASATVADATPLVPGSGPAAAPATVKEAASVPAASSAAPAPATPPANDAAHKTLPTLAMGPAANLAAAKAALPPAGLGAGLRAQAEDGVAAAQYEVGQRLADGHGVPRDLKAAADWFEKAAKQGLAPAAYRLGSLYEKGLGVSRDPAAALQWYQKAADAGNVRAMHNLAVMSAEGSAGKSDYAKAASWFSKAAQAGVRDSQFNLAILYARGLGVEQSLPHSYTWFAIAAAQGDVDATAKRDEVAQRLDPKALTEAKKTVDGFTPTAGNPAANDVAPPAGGWDAVAGPRGAAATTSSLTSGANARISSM